MAGRSAHLASFPRKKLSSADRRIPPTLLTCSECGKEFYGRKDRLTDSPRCKDARYRRLHRDKYRARQRRKYARRHAQAMTKRELEAAVVELAWTFGWQAARTDGQRKPFAARGFPWEKGFPGLVLVRDRVVFVALKGHAGRVRDEQTAWLEALAGAGVEAYVWRDTDWHDGLIEAVLRRRGPA